MKNAENVVVRFKKVIDDNRFLMNEELDMLDILLKKYQPITISEYARREHITQAAASKRVNAGKVPYILLAGSRLVLSNIS